MKIEEVQKRIKLVKTINFDPLACREEDFPTYSMYVEYLRLCDENRRKGVTVESKLGYRCMRQSLVVNGTNEEIANKLASCSDTTIECIIREQMIVLNSFFLADDYETPIPGNSKSFLQGVIANLGKLPAAGSQYNPAQFRQALLYTANPCMHPPGYKTEAEFRLWLIDLSEHDLKLIFNQLYNAPSCFFFERAQSDFFTKKLHSYSKGSANAWSGSQIKLALDYTLSVGYENEKQASASFYKKSKAELLSILATHNKLMTSYNLSKQSITNIGDYYMAERSRGAEGEDAAFYAFSKFYAILHNEAASTSCTSDEKAYEWDINESVTIDYRPVDTKVASTPEVTAYPGIYPLSDGMCLRNFLLLPNREIMSILANDGFLSWSRHRAVLTKEVKKATINAKTSKQVRTSIEEHFKTFGWKNFPTLVEQVQAASDRCKLMFPTPHSCKKLINGKVS